MTKTMLCSLLLLGTIACHDRKEPTLEQTLKADVPAAAPAAPVPPASDPAGNDASGAKLTTKNGPLVVPPAKARGVLDEMLKHPPALPPEIPPGATPPTVPTVYFATDKWSLTEETKQYLLNVAELLRVLPGTRLVLSGFADRTGPAAHNMTLSKDRADAVEAFLVSNGASAGQFDVVAYGETKPRVEGDTPEAWARNRCVELTVAEGAVARR